MGGRNRVLCAIAATAVIGSSCGWITRLSVDDAELQADADSRAVSVDDSGRHSAFSSQASDLVPGDTNGASDVFVRDAVTGTTTRVSVDSAGVEADDPSTTPQVSGDGRFVAFVSGASNIVPGDGNTVDDVFVHDRLTGATERVSVGSTGTGANAASSGRPGMSDDGRYVAFMSSASNLVPGDGNATNDVFVHDRQTGVTERVSVDSTGIEADGPSLGPATLADDGRHVAFVSGATNLVSGDGNAADDVFVHDRVTGTTERISVDSTGIEADGPSASVQLSGDGNSLVFTSTATNLVTPDLNPFADAYVHDRQTGATTLASLSDTGEHVSGAVSTPSISDDGRFVAFDSAASDVAQGDTNSAGDVFVHDRSTASTTRVSIDSFGAEADGASASATLSGDGDYVAFSSSATDLVSGDTNGADDVFLRRAIQPTIDSMSPATAAPGTDLTVTVEGTGFSAGMGAKFSGSDIAVTAVTMVSETELELDVTVGWGERSPSSDLFVWDQGSLGALTGATALCADCLTIDAPDPANVVFVMTDDMRPNEMDQVADMKPGGGFDWIRDNGVRFDRTWSTNNLCCPGRVTALTGQTSYNHGVLDNQTWLDLQNSLPSWVQEAGYCTGFTGKWLNPYRASRPRPAGWTHWEALTAGYADEYNYSIMQRDGTVWNPGAFITDHLGEVSRAQLTDCLDSGAPTMVALWPFAPHVNSQPEPDYEQTPVAYTNSDPSFNEADISDKPAWLQTKYATRNPNLAYSAAVKNTTRIRTLLSVDDAVVALISELAGRGELAHTLIILTADNGQLLGEHRIPNDKLLAYEAAQPTAWIAGPGFPSAATTDAYATNLDLAPTIARATGARPLLAMDGRPLQDVLEEADLGHDRYLPIFVSVHRNFTVQPTADAIRTWRYKYVAYSDGSSELYDLFLDSYELTNVVDDPSYDSIEVDMAALLADRMLCSGDTCRENAPAHLQG